MGAGYRSEVVGTSRFPDGDINGKIVLLYLAPDASNVSATVHTLSESVERAIAKELSCRVPGNNPPIVAIEAYRSGPGVKHPDRVRTVPDATGRNNLLSLPVISHVTGAWLDPLTGQPIPTPESLSNVQFFPTAVAHQR